MQTATKKSVDPPVYNWFAIDKRQRLPDTVNRERERESKRDEDVCSWLSWISTYWTVTFVYVYLYVHILFIYLQLYTYIYIYVYICWLIPSQQLPASSDSFGRAEGDGSADESFCWGAQLEWNIHFAPPKTAPRWHTFMTRSEKLLESGGWEGTWDKRLNYKTKNGRNCDLIHLMFS